MNYNLNQPGNKKVKNNSLFSALSKMVGLVKNEHKTLIIAFIAILVNALLSLLGPYIIGYTIDHHVQSKNYQGILFNSGILILLYGIAFIANYLQMRLMGGVGQRMLFSLRNALFNKLQELPLDFFVQNKAGDLISRLNNDTDKVNQFFSQSLMQFIGSIVTITGAGIFLLSINFRLGLAVLAPAVFIWIFTRLISPWIKRTNAINLKNTGKLSAEIQESLNNFKVIVAFNRRDYFRKRFEMANNENYKSAIKAGIANNVFMPVYTFAANIGQLIVLTLGIYLIVKGYFSIGLLISFLAYVNNFYHPLRQLAALWANFQVAMAGWDRISEILSLKTNLTIKKNIENSNTSPYLSFNNVTFKYPNGKEVLHNVSFELEKGKTYAFVGPTGGGKTTTASLIARLYDTTNGSVLLEGRNIKTFLHSERTQKIGFILQEPFLFTGTVYENIIYGNDSLQHITKSQLIDLINDSGLDTLLGRFEHGLETTVQPLGDSISLGQKQIIAFMRTIIRKPELLILDEATANIDTITELQLETILNKLPQTTTRVIIAHRLNTIENADVIYFINSGEVTKAGSLEDAVKLLLHGKRVS